MKSKRYIVVPLVLLTYAVFMSVYFGLEMLREGQTLKFTIICCAEALVLVLLSLSIRKRDRLKAERLERERKETEPS